MPFPIKYNSGNVTGSVIKGNVALAVNNIAGPTSTTGWYNGPNFIQGTYQIVETSASGDPDVYCPQNENELIQLVKSKGALSGVTGSSTDALIWIGTQPNLLAINEVYPNIVTDGDILNLDAGFAGSYPVNPSQVNLLYSNGVYSPSLSSLTIAVTQSTLIPNNKFRITTPSNYISPYTYGSFRLNIPLSVLVNAQPYNLSFKYQLISGSLFNMGDWCDTTLFNVNNTNYGTYTYSSAAGVRSIYDSTYRFMDFAIETSSIVDIWDIQLTQNVSASLFNTGSGTSWYDISGYNNSGSLINGPTYNSNGYIVFDGIDDVVNLSSSITQSNWSLTSKFQFNIQKTKNTQTAIFTTNSTSSRVGRSLLEFTYSVTIYSITVDSSGSIFLGGRIVETNGTKRELIVKLNPSGSVTTAFNSGLYINQTQDITGLALDSTGSLFYVGYNVGNLTKLNPTTGTQLQTISSVNASITQANVLLDEPNNKVYIGGWFTSIQSTAAQRIARLNLNTMTIDTTFNTTTGFVNTEDVQTIALQSNGKVLVGGQFTSYKGSTYNRIIRLNSDASIDNTFNIGNGFDNNVNRNCIVVQPDGKIIVGGSFTTYSGSTANRIVRLNPSGSIDNTFNIGVGFNSNVNDIKLQPDGKILAVGDFTSYSGSSTTRIIRLNSDGTKDTTFNIGSGANSSPTAIYLQNDGKILVAGGLITSYSGSNINQVFRITNSGSLDLNFDIGTGILGAYRLNNQVLYKNSTNTLTSQYFYNITAPTSYNWAPFETASLPLLNKFSEYTLTKDSSNVYRQYWNGQLINNVTQSTALDTGFDVNRIGTLNGEINTFSVYNKSLSQDEINQNYYQAPIVTNGLIFASDAGNLVSFERGSTTTFSLTGSATGSLINSTGYTSNNGGSWVFDGVDDYVIFTSSSILQPPSSITLELFFQRDSGRTIINYGADGGGASKIYCFEQFNAASSLLAKVTTTVNGQVTLTGPILPTGSWSHVAMTYNGSTASLYINGSLYTSSTASGDISYPANASLNLGRKNAVDGEYINGKIAVTRIYNRGLTAQEISQNFNAQKGRFGF